MAGEDWAGSSVLVRGEVTVMLVPSDMVSAQTKLMHQIEKFQSVQVSNRSIAARKTIHDVCTVVQDMLKEVEAQEPRFISSLSEINGRFDGLRVISPTEFEVVLYLNQMGEFNFVDDGTMPGCAVLKLSDGRKRSMSLWVEFITASGYLSARKIRCRFQTLVAQACDKSSYRDSVKMMNDASEVKIRIREKYVVQITPAFKCQGVWPRSAAHWPSMTMPWPHPNLAATVKLEGFDLLSKESIALQQKQSSTSMEGDAWIISLHEAESSLLVGGARKKVLSMLKCIKDRNLDFQVRRRNDKSRYFYIVIKMQGNPVTVHVLQTLVLYECEKHPREEDWEDSHIGDRISGILMQLISCLQVKFTFNQNYEYDNKTFLFQCRKCPHYFLPSVDLFRGKSPSSLDNAAKLTWGLLRELLTNSSALESL